MISTAIANVAAKQWRRLLGLWRRTRRQCLNAFRSGRSLCIELLKGSGAFVLPPWRCPGCGGWRKRRRLSPVTGVVAQPLYRQLAFATGCPRCGLLYATPRADQGDMYSASGEWASSHAVSDPDEVRSIDTNLLNAVDAISGVCTPAQDHRALDFGCGNGRWLDSLKARGWRTAGIDPALKSAFHRHEELHAIPAEPQFHFVVLSHVLEHVADPGALLARLGKGTVVGGWIYVAVPSLDGLPDHQDWPYVLNARAHTSAFSADCLAVLLARAGFGDVHVVRLPRRSGNNAKRLRVLAQRGAPATRLPARPLEAALTALRASSSAGQAAGARAPRRR